MGPGDMCGEAAVMGSDKHLCSASVVSQELVALRFDRTDLLKLLHPSDVQVRQAGGVWGGERQPAFLEVL